MLYKPWSCSRDKLTKLIATPSRTRSRTQPTNPVSNDSVHTPGGTFLWYTARPPNPNMIPFCRCNWLESPATNRFLRQRKTKQKPISCPTRRLRTNADNITCAHYVVYVVIIFFRHCLPPPPRPRVSTIVYLWSL